VIPLTLKNGETSAKKNITICDDSEYKVDITFWRDLANIDVNVGQVIALKNVKIHEFNIRSLNTGDSTQIIREPEHERTKEIALWWSKAGQNNLKSVSKHTSKAPMCPNGKDSFKLIGEVEEYVRRNNSDDTPLFFANAYVTYMKQEDRSYYPACPNESCKKKVFEDSNKGYKCDTCQTTFQTVNITYVLSGKIEDCTDNVFASFYGEPGEKILGITAQELKNRTENKDIKVKESVTDLYRAAVFKKHGILLKGRHENYNGEQKLKYSVYRIQDYNVDRENKQLLKRLAMYEEIN